MPDQLLPPSFLFHMAVPCLRHALEWTSRGLQLGEEHRLLDLTQLDGGQPYAEVRAGWSERGLGLSVRVQGKRQAPWCRESQFEESDGLHVFVDTRDTRNIHRAGRFCHRFGFLPSGGGPRREDAVAGHLLINRAKEHPKPAHPSQLLVRSEKRVDGYLLDVLITAGALTGYDPIENPRLGFMYALVDRELGEQTFGVSREFPYRDDPSLWGTVELVGG